MIKYVRDDDNTKNVLKNMFQVVKDIDLTSTQPPNIMKKDWLQTSFTQRDTKEPLFLKDFMNIHLWNLASSKQKYYHNYGTNKHSTKDYSLSEWRDDIFAEGKYAHIFCADGHYFQVRPYNSEFFKNELKEASDNLFREILNLFVRKY